MAATTLTSNVSDATARVQEKASDAFRTGRMATADVLDATAARINKGGDKVAEVAHSTAEKLTHSAEYMREHDAKAMVGDIESLIKAHPGKFLVGALVFGFLAGRAFRRD